MKEIVSKPFSETRGMTPEQQLEAVASKNSPTGRKPKYGYYISKWQIVSSHFITVFKQRQSE